MSNDFIDYEKFALYFEEVMPNRKPCQFCGETKIALNGAIEAPNTYNNKKVSVVNSLPYGAIDDKGNQVDMGSTGIILLFSECVGCGHVNFFSYDRVLEYFKKQGMKNG